MNGVGGIDGTTPDYDADARKRDEDTDLDRLRRQESALSAAYKRNPGDLATMGALVRVQQTIRHAEEHAAWTAQGGSMSAHDQLTNLGVKLPVDLTSLPPAQLDASVVADASVVPPIAHARAAVAPANPPATPTPFRGVGLYSAVEPELPASNASAGDPIHIGPYRLHLATANGVGVYYVAYNVDTKRNEWAVGASEADLATFRGMHESPLGVPNLEQLAQLATPKSVPDLIAQRAMQAGMEGRFGDAAVLFGKSHLAALTSVDWYAQNMAALGLGVSGPAARPLTEHAIEGAAARSAPDLRLVVNNPTPEVRALETAVDGNAALALGPVAPRPALSLVPTPAPGALTRQATPLAMPWMAPGLFATTGFRPATALGTTPTAAPLRGAPGSDELANGCVGRPLGYHLGGDEVHNTCADNIGNDYPGSDYLVVTPEGTTRAFDLAKLPEVGEVKTGKLSYYSEELANRTIQQYAEQSRADQVIAERCGLSFTLYIADPAAVEYFQANLEGVHVEAASDPACKRP
jgi:hypothetical protein